MYASVYDKTPVATYAAYFVYCVYQPSMYDVGLGNILMYRQYWEIRSCNNGIADIFMI